MENEKFEYEQEIESGEEAVAEEQIVAENEEAITVEQIVSEYSQPQEENSTYEKASPFADSPYESNYTGRYQQPAAKPRKAKVARKAKTGSAKRVLAAVLALALVAGSCGATAMLVNNRWEKKTRELENSISKKLEDLQNQVDAAKKANAGVTVVDSLGNMSTGGVYTQNVDAVVLISCQVNNSYFGQSSSGTSTGSGFIITEDGYVVTNYHVVEGATKIFVNTHEGDEFSAVLVGQDSTNDVAVLKIEDAQNLPCVTLGSSTELAVGDQVVAIGNPLGDLTATLTVGYVSAKDRDVNTDGTVINMIQTDAAINSGNSGGPLFNMKGEVVGITTAKYSGETSSGASIEGIGFAIPIDDVAPMIDDLINYGYVTGAYLGVMVSDVDAESADYYGLPLGAYVAEVTPGYAAEKAGLRAKDIIVALGDYKVESVSGLTRALRNFSAGETTTLTIYRGGAEQVLSVTLDEKPQNTTAGTEATEPAVAGGNSSGSWYDYVAPFFGKPWG